MTATSSSTTRICGAGGLLERGASFTANPDPSLSWSPEATDPQSRLIRQRFAHRIEHVVCQHHAFR